MRQNQNAKRSRGRGRRSGNSGQNSFNRNTTFESNGPEGRLRGNAQQLFEKYTSLAHDAQSAGDRVLFEANSQFADHYYRIQQSILANAEQRRQNDERANGKKGQGRNEVDKSADDTGAEAKSETPDSEDSAQTDAVAAASESVEAADAAEAGPEVSETVTDAVPDTADEAEVA